jgi:hypothetical protein
VGKSEGGQKDSLGLTTSTGPDWECERHGSTSPWPAAPSATAAVERTILIHFRLWHGPSSSQAK